MAIRQGISMVKRYSIAEARDNFTGIVHEAEAGATVEVTRRGKPVAVLVAQGEYERLTQGRRGFREAYREFLARYPPSEENTLEPQEWLERDRDPSGGRDFSW
jgi:prevent-host-death family protein